MQHRCGAQPAGRGEQGGRAFIKSQKGGTKIGLVAFSGIAGLLVPPTTDKDKLLNAIDNLKTVRGTAIGQAILTSMDAIAEMNPNVARTGVNLGEPAPSGGPLPGYQPDTIVVLTDGSNTTGVDPVTAAGQAAARHVRVFTIGFGTTTPSPMMCTADQLGDGSAFGGRNPGGFSGGFPGGGFGGRGGGRAALEIDEDALNQGGEAHRRPLFPRSGRRSARRRPGRSSAGNRTAQAECRDQRLVPAHGHPARLHGCRSVDVVEPRPSPVVINR